MTPELAVDFIRITIVQSILLVSPLLGTAIGVGVSVSLAQSITSIQEQTLTFVPKLVVLSGVIVVSAPWMIRTMVEFTIGMFSRLPEMAQ